MEQQNRQEAQRVMIAERADVIKSRKGYISGLLPELNGLAKAFEGLNLGTFTADDLNDTVRNKAADIKRRYIEQEQAKAWALGISSLRDEVVEAAKRFNNPFADKLARLRAWGSPQMVEALKYLTVTEAGEVVMTDDDAARLEDDCHVYLTDPKEIEKYLLHQSIVRMLNEFFDNGDGLPVVGWWNFFPLQGGKFGLPENGCNYSVMISQVEAKRAEAQPAAEPTDTTEQPEPDRKPKRELKQQNRTHGGMKRGISKEPDYTDKGAESRQRRHRISPAHTE